MSERYQLQKHAEIIFGQPREEWWSIVGASGNLDYVKGWLDALSAYSPHIKYRIIDQNRKVVDLKNRKKLSTTFV